MDLFKIRHLLMSPPQDPFQRRISVNPINPPGFLQKHSVNPLTFLAFWDQDLQRRPSWLLSKIIQSSWLPPKTFRKSAYLPGILRSRPSKKTLLAPFKNYPLIRSTSWHSDDNPLKEDPPWFDQPSCLPSKILYKSWSTSLIYGRNSWKDLKFKFTENQVSFFYMLAIY
jgi:hypothetical protein